MQTKIIKLIIAAICFTLLWACSGCGYMTANALNVESSTSYRNKFIWHGYHVADDTFVQRVSLESGGFDLSGAWINPISDVDDVERYDLATGYAWEIMEGLTSRIGAGSFLYSELDKDNGFDVHSVNWTLRHDSGVAYSLAYLWPDNSASVVEVGQLHVLSIDREIGPLRAFGDVTYNDGFSPFGGKSVDDFSYARAGAVLDGPLGLRVTYYHQWALNDVFEDQDVIDLGFVLRF